MNLTYKEYRLQLKHTFSIARGSSDYRDTIIVQLEHDGIKGSGEAAPLERYGETASTVIEFLNQVRLPRVIDPIKIAAILDEVDVIAPDNYSAKAAMDIALHDWGGKRMGVPLWKMWGLNKNNTPLTSFTIGIDSPDMIEKKIQEADEFPILKVKVGVPGDTEIIKTIRKITDKTLRADANEGWKNKEDALDKILWLEEQNIELIEQPMPSDRLDDIEWIKERVHIPIIADESVKRLNDLPRLRGVFDGINIKLMKCGGIREAMKMINTAREMGLKIMLGCMIESSVGIAAAANLSPLVDYADLDGNILISNDPFEGISQSKGKLLLNDEAGLGVESIIPR
ncbi:MAG: dipeptide epimerase [Bacteroidota bacterium]